MVRTLTVESIQPKLPKPRFALMITHMYLRRDRVSLHLSAIWIWLDRENSQRLIA
jgi:hypothetical protein